VFEKWFFQVSEHIRLRRTAKKLLFRMLNSKLAMTLDSWRTLAKCVVKIRTGCIKILLR